MKRKQRIKESIIAKKYKLAMCYEDILQYEKANRIAEKLHIPLITKEECAYAELLLLLCKEGIVLTDGKLSLHGDYTKLLRRLKYHNLSQEALIRAVRIKGRCQGLTAIDCTAGMGEDSLLLAAAGFSVTLCEHNPIITLLLKDTIERAKSIPELADIVSRMTVIEGNSECILSKLKVSPDIIFLDPMFPMKKKKSLVKEKLQVLQKLESPCTNEEILLQAAMQARPTRIVIKRPAKGPYLANIKPSYSISGDSMRYDCIGM